MQPGFSDHDQICILRCILQDTQAAMQSTSIPQAESQWCMVPDFLCCLKRPEGVVGVGDRCMCRQGFLLLTYMLKGLCLEQKYQQSALSRCQVLVFCCLQFISVDGQARYIRAADTMYSARRWGLHKLILKLQTWTGSQVGHHECSIYKESFSDRFHPSSR